MARCQGGRLLIGWAVANLHLMCDGRGYTVRRVEPAGCVWVTPRLHGWVLALEDRERTGGEHIGTKNIIVMKVDGLY